VRPPIRDPYQREKRVLLRGEQQVIDAADALAQRFGISRNDALNAILRAWVTDPEATERLRLALVTAVAAATGAAAAEAYRQGVSR
jgi:hypothetical protein